VSFDCPPYSTVVTSVFAVASAPSERSVGDGQAGCQPQSHAARGLSQREAWWS
jgi:hypothetical protein